MDSRSGVCPHPLTSQPFLAQNLSLAPILPSHSTVHRPPRGAQGSGQSGPFYLLRHPAPLGPFSQPTFCPSNVPSKFWPLCTAVSSVLPQASTRLCKPKSKERPPHTIQSKPLALASCPRCLGVLQTPKMVCMFRPQCSFLYPFFSLTLSPSSPFPAEDKIQAEPHPSFSSLFSLFHSRLSPSLQTASRTHYASVPPSLCLKAHSWVCLHCLLHSTPPCRKGLLDLFRSTT